jgi:uncharacterized membrane protein (GlpM family)
MPGVQFEVFREARYDTQVRFVYGLLGFFALIGVTWLLVPTPSNSIEEIYSRGLFPTISSVLIPVTNLIPFSLAGIFLVLLPVVSIVVFLRSKRKSGASRVRKLGWHWLWRAPLIGLSVYGLFITVWGANYRRLPIEEILNLTTNTLQQSDLEDLVRDLLETVKRDSNAARNEPRALQAIRASITKEIQSISGVKPTLPTRVKATPPGLLLILETSGVVSPLTLEAHVDGGLPPPFFLAVAAHELVHTAGFAGEADTDLIAAIAGLNSSDAYARYSVALWYFLRVMRDLPSSTQQRLWKDMPKVALEDYQALRKATDTYQLPFAAEVSRAVYNQYLQTQGVEEGVRDYSRIGRLLAASRVQGRVFSR